MYLKRNNKVTKSNKYSTIIIHTIHYSTITISTNILGARLQIEQKENITEVSTSQINKKQHGFNNKCALLHCRRRLNNAGRGV